MNGVFDKYYEQDEIKITDVSEQYNDGWEFCGCYTKLNHYNPVIKNYFSTFIFATREKRENFTDLSGQKHPTCSV